LEADTELRLHGIATASDGYRHVVDGEIGHVVQGDRGAHPGRKLPECLKQRDTLDGRGDGADSAIVV
jgi:hypothetical protein